MRKFIAILLILAMGLSLTACNNDNNNDDSQERRNRGTDNETTRTPDNTTANLTAEGIVGSWLCSQNECVPDSDFGHSLICHLFFDMDGRFVATHFDEHGTFAISGNSVVLTFDSDVIANLEFTFENGKLNNNDRDFNIRLEQRTTADSSNEDVAQVVIESVQLFYGVEDLGITANDLIESANIFSKLAGSWYNDGNWIYFDVEGWVSSKLEIGGLFNMPYGTSSATHEISIIGNRIEFWKGTSSLENSATFILDGDLLTLDFGEKGSVQLERYSMPVGLVGAWVCEYVVANENGFLSHDIDSRSSHNRGWIWCTIAIDSIGRYHTNFTADLKAFNREIDGLSPIFKTNGYFSDFYVQGNVAHAYQALFADDDMIGGTRYTLNGDTLTIYADSETIVLTRPTGVASDYIRPRNNLEEDVWRIAVDFSADRYSKWVIDCLFGGNNSSTGSSSTGYDPLQDVKDNIAREHNDRVRAFDNAKEEARREGGSACPYRLGYYWK